MKQNDTIKLLKKLVFILIFTPCLMYSQETITWTGNTNSDWNTATNWDPMQVPTALDNVIINMAAATVEISSTTAAYAKVLAVIDGSLTINSGASLIAHGAVGNITYEVMVNSNHTRLMSSPVVGEQYDDTWITDNGIGTVGALARISTYDNSMTGSDIWMPYTTGGSAVTFESGVGYAIGLGERPSVTGVPGPGGTVSFEGDYLDDDITPAISTGANNNTFNFIGNPYSSYLDIEAFIAANTSNLLPERQAVYVRPAGSSDYIGLTSGHLHPGQGFFIRSNVASGTVSITQSMQRAVATFFRTDPTHPSINVILSDGMSTKETQINYLEDKTKGLNPRFDVGVFDETSSNLSIFTHLIEDNQGIAFGRQALPNSDLESMAVPVGVKATAGQEITFSVEALNLPTDLKVFLEDKLTNTFTRLDKVNTNYKVTLSEGLNGVGRFYLHTSKSVSSDATLNTVSIYKSDISTLRIVGLPQGNKTVKLFNILGKQVMNTSFGDDAKDISLPKLVPSVYIVDVQTEIGKLNKKIILE